MSYHPDKPNFLEFRDKIAKITLNVKVNDLQFRYHPWVSQDACLVQSRGFLLKPVTSYRPDKIRFMDEQMDRQTDNWTDRETDAFNDNIPSVWKAKGPLKSYSVPHHKFLLSPPSFNLHSHL